MIEQILIKYQASNLCDAMLRNVNDNFISVSFDYLKGGDILLKIILERRTDVEDIYIDDIITEFASLQNSNCVMQPEVQVGLDKLQLRNLVYQKRIPRP